MIDLLCAMLRTSSVAAADNRQRMQPGARLGLCTLLAMRRPPS